jgi:hypothetical protein
MDHELGMLCHKVECRIHREGIRVKEPREIGDGRVIPIKVRRESNGVNLGVVGQTREDLRRRVDVRCLSFDDKAYAASGPTAAEHGPHDLGKLNRALGVPAQTPQPSHLTHQEGMLSADKPIVPHLIRQRDGHAHIRAERPI